MQAFVAVSCCVAFGHVFAKKIPTFIQMLIDQPFAVGNRGLLCRGGKQDASGAASRAWLQLRV